MSFLLSTLEKIRKILNSMLNVELRQNIKNQIYINGHQKREYAG